MLTLTLLTIVCMVTYTVEIIFGLAGTILMVTVMSSFYETKILVIYSVLPQILVGSIGLYRSPKTVKLEVLLKMVLIATGGALLGMYMFYYFSVDTFHLLLASAITLFGIYMVLSPRILKLHEPVKRFLEFLAGASQALFGISGPIAMARLMGSYEDKTVIRNYALAFFLSLNVFRTGAYVYNNTFDHEILYMMAISGPFIFITLWFSNHLHMKINDVVFRRTVSWLILLGGISMFWP